MTASTPADDAERPHRPRDQTAMPALDIGLAAALTQAAEKIARLDQTLSGHMLLPAFLHRVRLDAVRRQAGSDGLAIDPWHLAAIIEGLRLRMDLSLSIAERGAVLAAARHALHLHGWIATPDCEQESQIQRAETALAGTAPGTVPLLAAGRFAHAWLASGNARAPMRAALIRYWTRHGVLCAPVPLTGAAALRADTAWEPMAWVTAFLTALAAEAEDASRMFSDMQRLWMIARGTVAGRRRNSRAAAAVDILAASPLVSATSLAAGLGMAVNNATALLDDFCAAGLVVEVTHRAKRRLFGLAGMAPLRDGVALPRRPMPGRGRGRPAITRIGEAPPSLPPPSLPPPSPPPPARQAERPAFDYSELEHWMAHAEHAMRHARTTLDQLGTLAPVLDHLGTPPGSDASQNRRSNTLTTSPGAMNDRGVILPSSASLPTVRTTEA